jgi:chromosome segregation ATPase
MRRGIVVLSLTLLGVIIGLVVGTRAVVSAEQPRPAAPSPDVLPALLVEVRGLRAAMEQMAAAGPRVQLALGRVQLQEQRINNLIRRLDEVRLTLGGAQTNYDHLRQASRMLEDALRAPAADGPNVEQLKGEQIRVAQEFATAQITLQRAIADEAAMASELSTEQARWTDLNQRMEALEATLGPR